jgi:hypothetical protein
MKGWIFRRAAGLKDFGERLAHIQIFGIRIMFWASRPVRKTGLALCAKVLNHRSRKNNLFRRGKKHE